MPLMNDYAQKLDQKYDLVQTIWNRIRFYQYMAVSKTYIQNLFKMWVLNNEELDKAEILEQIFKGKTTIVKIALGNETFALKYIEVQGELQINFYQHALTTINCSRGVSRLFTANYQFGLIKMANQRQYLCIRCPFLMTQNLERSLMTHPGKNENQIYHCKFIQMLPFILLDSFIQNIGVNTLIINESNVYPFPNDIAINQISFAGVDLIFFERSVKRQDFKGIFNYLHSNTFQKQPYQRLNHQQKIKNFAAILLVFLINRPVRLLEYQKLPQLINKQYANRLLKNSRQSYKKFLNLNPISTKITQHSRHWPLNLHQFFYEMLFEQKKYSWSEIYGKFLFESGLEFKQKSLIQLALNTIWSKLTLQQKKYLCQKCYINANQSDERITMQNSYILLTIDLKLKLGSLKNGSIFDELSDKRKFDMLTMEIVTKIVNLSIQVQKEPFKQSGEVHVGSIHDRVFQLKEECMEKEENQDSNATQKFESLEQPLFQQGKYQKLKQAGQIDVKMQGVQLQPLTKQAALDISKQFYKDKMVNSVEVQGKTIKIDHPRVKALKEFENSFR